MEAAVKELVNIFDFNEIESTLKEDFDDGIGHGILVSNLAYLLSKEIGFDEEFCYKMAIAGLLHDVGKLKLNRYLYGIRKDTLLIEEMKYMRMHPIFSYMAIKNMGYSEEILSAIYHHHENFDGSGFPDNLRGESIPVGARIIRICDVFIALISNRKYRRSFDKDVAVELMIDEVKNFDMKIFIYFQRLIGTKKIMEIFK